MAGIFFIGKINFYVTLDCFCARPIAILVDSMQRNPDVRANGNSTRRRAGEPDVIPSKIPLPVGDLDLPSNTQFLGPT